MSILEVCVDNIMSASHAEMGGADRIELCQALEVGGLTPNIGLMRKVKELVDIPVFVMIRPRSGSFFYHSLELDQMEEDIRALIAIGADGLVFGALQLKYINSSTLMTRIDREACQRLMNASNGLPVTFHRAFDLVLNPVRSAADIIDLGFSRILTSGQSPTAYEGKVEIAFLVKEFDSKITIMPGCGINESNLLEIKAFTGAREYHSSCQPYRCLNTAEKNVVKGTSYYSITRREVVENMKTLLNVN